MNNRIVQLWEKEEVSAFRGWDFSHLDGRWQQEKLPWDYKSTVAQFLKSNDKLLDMGTGGGEFLLTLNHPPNLTHVTEAYKPNVELCKKTLEPLGISVHITSDDAALPFESNSFDVIINKHESFNSAEVARMLKPQGFFISQQVGGQNNISLSRKLIENFVPQNVSWNISKAVTELETAGLSVIDSNEHFPTVKFFDVGAIVYFAKIIAWEFPGFKVETHLNQLKQVYEEIEQVGYIASIEHRFIVVCKKE